MKIEIYLVITIIAFTVLYFVVPYALGTYMKYRGKRLVICPETKQPAAVDVDVRHAAMSAVFDDPHLRLKTCSRWPEREGCGQECLAQIQIAPEDCLVRGMLTKWYKDKFCVLCGEPFGEIHVLDHKPAFLAPEGNPIGWDEVRPETLPTVLETFRPICWDCHVAESFRAKYPELVVERPWRGDAHFGT